MPNLPDNFLRFHADCYAKYCDYEDSLQRFEREFERSCWDGIPFQYRETHAWLKNKVSAYGHILDTLDLELEIPACQKK